MKYTVEIAGRSVEVEVDGDCVSVGGRTYSAALSPLPGSPLRLLRCGARTTAIFASYDEQGWTLQHQGRTHVVLVEDERTRQIRELTGQDGPGRSGGVVHAPMPGLVLRVDVEVGQAVEPDSGIVVLEAMKMENEIRAGARGIVRAVRVGPGDAVEKGSVLVELGES